MMECESSEASPWAWIATSRLRPSDDPFFDEGNAACHLSHKHFKTSAETDEEDDRSAMIACQIGQCAKTFHDICSYESHYHSAHSNRVPKEICFGKGHAKTFHQKKPKRKHWHQKEQTTKSKVNIEEVQMKDLADALEK
ncbi:hypothetical protein CAPTEDRAFT_210892 [Capitella teleta]|uniref:C2H2-type domain-containing protein n=1 Tax=Capitella teleta TaxID=283909 RepID=R7UST6_CAPTE|nr:hypothetical protein CAPTEDRAFT_210892 [Capitella teleta]|eukprot:ELU06466.1 hypothetical protein CAPTEDRAFT_210892 [Capitella teleta]